jgi:hypothetical protein
MGKEVQLHERGHTKTAARAQSGGPVQGADTGTDEPDQRSQHGTNGRGPISQSQGWIGYFGKCATPSVLVGLEQWLRRRLRSAIWKQWKRARYGLPSCSNQGVGDDLTAQTAGSALGPWRLANWPALSIALSNANFDSLGFQG